MSKTKQKLRKIPKMYL